MVDIEFIYNQSKISLQCNLNDKMKDIFQKFTIKVDMKREDIYFLYNGSTIEEELTLNEIINPKNIQNNKIQILVNDINNINKSDENECLKPSKNIICPNCKESIRITIHDYKVKLYGCRNNHITDNLPLNQFENTQMINEKKIICEKCQISNKNDTYENKFFRCLTCKMNICPLCKTNHDKTHNIIDYAQKFFICEQHNEAYNSYCKDCSKNICLLCENEHIEHNLISFGRIMPNINALKEEINSQKEKISQFINGIEDIINRLNSLIDNIEIYYKIYDNIISNYEVKNRNFSLLQNIIDIRNYNNDFYNTINKINDEKNIVNKFSYLMDIYDKMNLKNKISNEENINIKKEENIEIKDTNLDNNKINDKNIIDDINNNKEFAISKTGKVSDNTKELKIGNFDNFEVTQLKIKDSYLNENKVNIIYILKDEKIVVIEDEGKFYLLSITDKINEVFNVDLNLRNLQHLIQLDDGNLIISDNFHLHLFKLNNKGIEKIESFNIYSSRINKLSKDNIITLDNQKISLYSYENNKKLCHKFSFEISELKCKFDALFELFNGVTYTSLHDIFVINENEILIFYTYTGIGDNNQTHYFLFYNVKKGKNIKSIKIGTKDFHSADFSLYDKNNLFASYKNKIFLIDLKSHSIKNTFIIDNDAKSFSLISLNKKFILVAVKESHGYYIWQYEFEKQKKLIFKCKKKIKDKYKFIGKCNGNNLIMKYDTNQFIIFCERY